MAFKFYHAVPTDRTTPDSLVFCHNLTLNNGELIAESYKRIPGSGHLNHGFQSLYEMFNVEKEKEECFESIRGRLCPHRPSRLGSIFLFDDRTKAEECNLQWWQGSRSILEAEIVEGTFGRFDGKHLDSRRQNWQTAALMYWKGMRSDSPRIEVVVQGIVQLHGFEQFAARLKSND